MSIKPLRPAIWNQELNCYMIELSQDKVALVSTQDAEAAAQFHWYVHHGVPERVIDRKSIQKLSWFVVERMGLELGVGKLKVKTHNGDPLDCRRENLWVPDRKPRWLEELGCYAIPLNEGFETLVDAQDVEALSDNWSAQKAHRSYYAVKGKNIRMHRVIAERMGLDIEGKDVDHINGNGLDNRRSNLRPALAEENARNRKRNRNNKSGFKGVSKRTRGDKWVAQIEHNGKNHWLGDFSEPLEAAKAYDAKAIELHGKFAKTNFPFQLLLLGTD